MNDTAAVDFWNERRVSIPGNSMLEGMANHLLTLTDHEPSLLDGDKIADIDWNLRLAIWMDEGLGNILTEEQRPLFMEWAKKNRSHIDPEAVSRARRYLMEKDLIRLSSNAVKDAEGHRQRIARSVK